MQWLFFLAFLAYAGVSSAYPNPGLVTGDINPVHDPTLCRDNTGKYFLFSTATGIEIRTSTDRIAWTLEGVVFPNGASWTDEYTGTSNGDLWAPDCTYLNGQFYVKTVSLAYSRSGIFLATSTTGLPGSFVNHGLITSTAPGDSYNAIDPNLIIDGDQWYLSLGSFWTGIKGTELVPQDGTVTGSLDSLAARSGGTTAIEASVIYKNGDFYYLFTSWDQCCQGTNSTYNIRVGRSTSLRSGYVDANGVPLTSGGGTLVLETHDAIVGPGGQDLLTDVDGPILVYHYYTAAGPLLGINRLDFSSGWPVVA
ncbi:glycoside hydrolase family 43 protein [Fomitiporia mediterranea MF3/22]|uniref:glycoside hydrolase family 43 protein n=1 Tax=Fomitiporia mediterranea (strain MF3/22) TaxID=694068 RepID=UPI0004408CA6|nr:glycoside hydrolase family 43 protein [Fomitiporia mediterranea MF3/22]EJD00720.1 glycoside hydrolase family 43 protein [Fomitiporia mediterranea MF3/22]